MQPNRTVVECAIDIKPFTLAVLHCKNKRNLTPKVEAAELPSPLVLTLNLDSY